MIKNRSPLFLSAVGLLILLGLAAGCHRPASPNVTATSAGGAEAAPQVEGTPDFQATSIANSTMAAQPTQEEEAPTATPTSPPPPPPTQIPSPTPIPPTPVPPTPEPATPTTAPPTSQASPTGGQITHVVQRGENLFRIALRYSTTVEAIASVNGIANPALIYVGQELTIPSSGSQPTPQPGGETTYVVQAGDNLFRIALRYNMSYLELAQYNGIANPSRIYVGQVLRIP